MTKASPKKLQAASAQDLFSEAMINWHAEHGRKNLPWQIDNTPYHTWLSEVMLQQTQVKTVIPYYERFTQRFPTIQDLAAATTDEVLHMWTGLGYYTRARNLHKCAETISTQYQGKFPNTVAELEALPGIGRSTAGAIVSLSMDIAEPILDGNVKRVFCRFYCIDTWSGNGQTQKQLWKIAEDLLPKQQVKAYNQSLMDLGATICKRGKPLCELCPLAPECQSYRSGTQKDFPVSKPKKAIPTKHCHMLILQNKNGGLLLEQRPSQGIWGGLWSFPEFTDLPSLNEHCQQNRITVTKQTPLEEVKHTFSHFHLMIQPIVCQIKKEPDNISESKHIWYKHQSEDKPDIGLASPVKKLIEKVSKAL